LWNDITRSELIEVFAVKIKCGAWHGFEAWDAPLLIFTEGW
jgi:hypothetical protein